MLIEYERTANLGWLNGRPGVSKERHKEIREHFHSTKPSIESLVAGGDPVVRLGEYIDVSI